MAHDEDRVRHIARAGVTQARQTSDALRVAVRQIVRCASSRLEMSRP